MFVKSGEVPSVIASAYKNKPSTSIVEITASNELTRRSSGTSELMRQLFNHSELIGTTDENGNTKPADKVIIDWPEMLSGRLVIERGKIPYRVLKDGSEKQIGSIYKGHYYVVIDNTKVYIHQLQVLFSQPDLLEAYLADDDLEVNHLRSPGPGETYYEVDPLFLEVVSSKNNKLHGRFKKLWGLHRFPVSALECDSLDKEFRKMAEVAGLVVQPGWGTPVDFTGFGDLRNSIEAIALKRFYDTFAQFTPTT